MRDGVDIRPSIGVREEDFQHGLAGEAVGAGYDRCLVEDREFRETMVDAYGVGAWVVGFCHGGGRKAVYTIFWWKVNVC